MDDFHELTRKLSVSEVLGLLAIVFVLAIAEFEASAEVTVFAPCELDWLSPMADILELSCFINAALAAVTPASPILGDFAGPPGSGERRSPPVDTSLKLLLFSRSTLPRDCFAL